MSDRERLVKLLDDAYKSVTSSVHSHRVADVLLAAGVTLPPAPEPLVTEEMLNSTISPSHFPVPNRTHYCDLTSANALVAAAIRRAVERKTSDELYEFYRKLGTVNSADSGRIVLSLFGLDGGAS